jgi:hypothetical protein
MDEAAATYAAWSPTMPPAWLGAATLAELGFAAPGEAAAARAAVGAAGAAPYPRFTVALLGTTLLAGGFAALALGVSGSLDRRDPLAIGPRLPGAAPSVQMAAVPGAGGEGRRSTKQRAPRHARAARRTHSAPRAQAVAFVPVRAVAPKPPASAPAPRPTDTPPRPTPRPKRAPRPMPAPAPAPAAPAPAPPASVTADAPADGAPANGFTVVAVPASAEPAPPSEPSAGAPPAPSKPTTTAPPAPSIAASAPAEGAGDHDGGEHRGRRPCPPPPPCQRRSCRH